VLLPDRVAADAHLADGTEVDVALDGDRVVLTPVPPTPSPSRSYRIEDLLAGITGDDQPPELFADALRGDEVCSSRVAGRSRTR
jgi:antitoxin component of MazEF toxin-antitoxin module